MTRKSKPPIAIYSALADATRCRIIEILLNGPIPVHTLADAFVISRPAISRHLRVLKTAGLVAEVKKGRENLYALRTRKLGPAMAWIDIVASRAAAPEAAVVETEDEVVVEVAISSATETAVTELSPPSAPIGEVPTPSPAELDPLPAIAEVPQPLKAKPKKATKAERIPQPEPSLNQMGFDF